MGCLCQTNSFQTLSVLLKTMSKYKLPHNGFICQLYFTASFVYSVLEGMLHNKGNITGGMLMCHISHF